MTMRTVKFVEGEGGDAPSQRVSKRNGKTQSEKRKGEEQSLFR